MLTKLLEGIPEDRRAKVIQDYLRDALAPTIRIHHRAAG